MATHAQQRHLIKRIDAHIYYAGDHQTVQGLSGDLLDDFYYNNAERWYPGL